MYKKISVIASALVWVLLPKCSACLMAYMGIFSALGIGNLTAGPYTLIAIKMLLFINLAASLYMAIKERQYLYAFISFFCAMVFIVNKFYFDSIVINILTGIVLVAAALQVRMLRINARKCRFETK